MSRPEKHGRGAVVGSSASVDTRHSRRLRPLSAHRMRTGSPRGFLVQGLAAGADPSLKAQHGTSLLVTGAAGARLKTFTYACELRPERARRDDDTATCRCMLPSP